MSTPTVIARLPVPSTALLRTFLRPTSAQHAPCQVRSTSNFMPRHKYAKVTRLDKLHRQEKKQFLEQRLQSYDRAVLLEETMKPALDQESASPVSFHIARTKTRNLPVYESVKAGGSKKITTLRHLSGDLAAAQTQLLSILNLPAFTIDVKGRKRVPIEINHLNRHIVIRGWRGAEVKKWAELLGF